MSYWNFNFIKK